MSTLTATAVANANIALIKYWGNRDQMLRLPVNGSISMNLGGLFARTQVTFDAGLPCDEWIECDQLTVNGQPAAIAARERVSHFLNYARRMARVDLPARVVSENNFPMGAGIASSAAAFAALAVAVDAALNLQLDHAALSRMARLGSGSACRSVPAGFVEWNVGEGDKDSIAYTIAPPDHWPLIDCITLIERGHKAVGSTQGHEMAASSPLQAARVQDTPRRLDLCRNAILMRDFDALAQVMELDSNLMHAVMMTSAPMLMYWTPLSLAVMQAVQNWRASGLPVAFTLDAGPNVHVLTESGSVEETLRRLRGIDGVLDVLTAPPGGAAHRI